MAGENELIPAGEQPVVDRIDATNPVLVSLKNELGILEHHYLTTPFLHDLYKHIVFEETLDVKSEYGDLLSSELVVKIENICKESLENHKACVLSFTNASNETADQIIRLITGFTEAFHVDPIELYVNTAGKQVYDTEYRRGDTFARVIVSKDEVQLDSGCFVDCEPVMVHLQGLSVETASMFSYLAVAVFKQERFSDALLSLKRWVASYG